MIKPKEHHTFLEVIIDSKLNWHHHINMIRNTIKSSIYAINKVIYILSIKYPLTLYYSTIHSYLNYCLVLWGNSHATYRKPILVLQNKAIRAISKTAFNEHTNDFVAKLKVLKLNDLYAWNLAKIMYIFHTDKNTTLCSNYFCKK